MISQAELNGCSTGSDYMETSMRDGGNGLESQSPWPPITGASPALPSSRTGSRAKSAPLTKKLLNSISAQFRRSLSSMGSGRSFFENGKKYRTVSSLSQDPVEEKVMQVIERVRGCGYSEEICHELRNHFARLPARYTLNIDAQRHEDVLLHMNLLREAWKVEAAVRNNPTGSYPLPQVHVRKVQLLSGVSWFDTCDLNGGESMSKAVPIPRIPKPAFGSNTNLAGLLVGGSPRVHPSSGHSKSQSTPPSLKTLSSPSIPETIPRPTFGSFVNPLEMEEDNDQEDAYGWEITLATSDRRGLLKIFTNALSTITFDLNIQEAHVFSTTDGMALEVFVVEGWSGDEPEDLRNAVLEALNKQLCTPPVSRGPNTDMELRNAVEALAYEDWTVDFQNLVIGERLGGGSSGRLYRGQYLSQDVAIKIIELNEVSVENESGTLRSVPAVELLQMFKQEVSIMRLVRHKNLVQFIGACSCWPKLCIVTELMAGGSVRDVMQSKGTGLDIPAAVKVLRDAARGMDFLHRRGIVHRDLKAANLLIDEHDVVKVCDFGVARIKPAVSSNHGGGNWTAEMTAETGTYRWMSPEVLEHKPYDHKADVYSFGIMIWEVLTGEIPYAGLTPLQAAIGVVQRGLRPVMPPSVPPKLAGLAELCWQQNPDQRPEFNEAVTILEELMKPSFKKALFGKMKFGSNHHLKSVDQQEVKTSKSHACKGRKKKNVH